MIDVLPGLSPENAKLYKIFQPAAYQRTIDAYKSSQRFVHYTNADTALKIIYSQEMWMRKSSCMNDFMELEHGFDHLKSVIDTHKKKIENIFDKIFEDFTNKTINLFDQWLPSFRKDTFITCISEHDNSEDSHGRLSMWRAYGGKAGVAIVVKGSPFFVPTDALKAYTSPVVYSDKEKFERNFLEFLDSIKENMSFIENLELDIVEGQFFEVLRSSMLGTKHPGFHEEREWRIIYSPSYSSSSRIKTDIQSINGVPQRICKIPLQDIPEENLVGIEISSLIDRIIIGPTQYPNEIREAFIELMRLVGFENPEKIVIISDIPLRN